MKSVSPALIEFASREAMAADIADRIESALADAIARRGAASLAVSGGSTPADLYRMLAARALPWADIAVALVDERWTPPGSNGSNETFVRETLLQNKAANAGLAAMWSEAQSPEAGLAAAEARYGKIAQPFDAVVLGMGADGHTASWFPHAEGLDAALSLSVQRVAHVRAVKSAVTGDHLDRLTLTLGALVDAHAIHLMISGADKREVFHRAAEDGPVEDMPVRAILRARPDLRALWAP